jgi:site-specific DNA recombinase
MGGTSPIGYDVCERRLVVNQTEAKTVRTIFERYLELGRVRLLKTDLDRRGILSARKTTRKGKLRGGKPFSRGALYNLLSNPIYIGEIRHRRERYPGQHEPVVSRELWEQVQLQLGSHAARTGEGRKTTALASPLAGKLFDENGEPLYVQGSAKGQRRYRYYVSKGLVNGAADCAEAGWRLSAPQLERTLTAAAAAILEDRAGIALASEAAGKDDQLPAVLKSAQAWAERLRSTTESTSVLAELTERVELAREGVKLFLQLPFPTLGTANAKGRDGLALTRFVPMVMKRRGVEQRIVLGGGSSPTEVYQPLLKAVGRSRKWVKELMAGQIQSVDELARREKLDGRSVRATLARLGVSVAAHRRGDYRETPAARDHRHRPVSATRAAAALERTGRNALCAQRIHSSVLATPEILPSGADGPSQIPTG